MSFLELKPGDCSPLGHLILQYLQENQLSMTELADKAGITRPGLRAMCLKRSNPTKSSIQKLARVMDRPTTELYRLVALNKIINAYEPDAIDFILEVFETVFKALHKLAEKLPERERPSDFELLDKTLKTIKSLQD